MKYKKLYRLAWMLPVALVACTDDTYTVADDPVSGAQQINITCEVTQSYQSRVDDGGFTQGDAIGVYIVDYRGDQSQKLHSTGNHATNVKFTYDASNRKWNGVSKIYWTDEYTHCDAYSYYPFAQEIEDVNSYKFTIVNRQDKEVGNTSITGYEASDFLWAKAENAEPNKAIELQHQHIMASVMVNLVEGEGFNGTWDQTEKQVNITNTYGEGNIDLEKGEITPDTSLAPAFITPYYKGGTWRGVIIPQTVNAGVPMLAITIDGEGYDFARDTDSEFSAGKLHKFTIKVNKRKAGEYEFVLLNVTVIPWEADEISHDGITKTYTIVNVPTPGSLKNSVESMGINPSNIDNLKITGTMNQDDFDYMKSAFKKVLALNLREVRTVNVKLFNRWYGGPLGYGIFDDNREITDADRFDDATPCMMLDGMSYLNHFVFPDHTKYIGVGALHGTSFTGTLVIPDGVIWIGGDCANQYYDGSNIHVTKLNIPESVVFIGDGAFSYTSFTNELKLPAGLKYLGDNAFDRCTETFGTAFIPDGIEYLGDFAFREVPLTGHLAFPAGMKRIPNAFNHTNITSISIPDGAEEIAQEAFAFPSLSGDVYLPNTIKKIGRDAFTGSKISHINIPTSMEEIPRNMLKDCKYLMDSIVVPENIRWIMQGSFEGCSNLSTIILPSKLEIIGGDNSDISWAYASTFGGCYSLEELRCDAKVPPTCINEPFSGLDSQVHKDNFTVVVPEESVEEYQNTECWREFKRISPYRNLVFRPQKAKLLNAGGKRELVLNADAGKSWTITECPSWAHVSSLSGKGKTQLTLTIDKMSHGQPDRYGEILVSLDGTDYISSLKIWQYDYEYDEDQGIALQDHSRGAGIPLVFVGDGFDAEDISIGTYMNDMQQFVEYFFDVEPYKTYRDYFDVYTAIAMSYESGINSVNYPRNTKFDTNLGNGNYESRISSEGDRIIDYCVDNTPVKEADLSKLTCIMVGNTAAYEGVAYMYSNGTGLAICTKSAANYPGDARGICQHEAGGHAFGKLADEYIYHRAHIDHCGCNCCEHSESLESMHCLGWGWNLSLSDRTVDLPWRHMISDPRVNDIVDLWDGGYFHSDGVYRSEYNSCMNNNVPYFSTWSRELIVRRIMECAGQTYNYENFIANDSREWGRDFTLGGRAAQPTSVTSPSKHSHPQIINRAPKLNHKH